MTQLTALVWKEWRENRWFVAAGLFVFLGLPLLGAVTSRLSGYPRFEILAWPWVFYLGGVLAVFVGTSAGTRDFAGRLEAFWKSRPIAPTRWLLVKYAVGLAGLLLTCMLPLAAEEWVGAASTFEPLFAHRMLGWGPFHWAAVYTAAFVIGCVFRRPAQATTLAFAVLALVYFAPVVLPPLERVSVAWVADRARDRVLRFDDLPHPWAFGQRPDQVPFVVTMAGLSVALLVLAVVARRRDWEVQSGWRTMYASVGSVLFLLFAAAAFQLGSNLPVLQEHKLGDGERAVAVYSDGTNGVLFTGSARGWETPLSAVRAVTVTPAGVSLGSPIGLPPSWAGDHRPASTAWVPEHPTFAFFADARTAGGPYGKLRIELVTVRIDPAAGQAGVSRVDLWEEAYEGSWRLPDLFGSADRILVWGSRAAIVDIRSPQEPKVTLLPVEELWGQKEWFDSRTSVPLPQWPDASPRLRLDAAISRRWFSDMEGDTQCVDAGGRLTVSRLVRLTETMAHFEEVGRYEPPLLMERLFGGSSRYVTARNGLAYLSHQAYYAASRFDNPRLTVVDVRDPTRPRAVGHFAVPGDRPLAVCPLAEGRAVVGGTGKLYVLGPPPSR